MRNSMILLLSAGAILAACDKQMNNDTATKEEGLMTFSASVVNTKTEIKPDGKTVLWSDSDVISVFDAKGGSGNVGAEFTSALNSDHSAAVFTGTVATMSDYHALYPLAAVHHWKSDGAATVFFNIPSEQTAVKGSFPANAGVMVASATDVDKNFTFKHIPGYIKFTIGPSSPKIKSVSVTEPGSKKICGVVSYNYETSDIVADGGSTVTLLPPTGSDVFAEGTYYMAVRPLTFEKGVSFVFTDASDVEHPMSLSGKLTVASGDVKNLGTIGPLSTVKVGDIKDGGVVVSVSGSTALIMSLKEYVGCFSTVTTKIGAGQSDDAGETNTAKIFSVSDYSAENYPFAAWVKALGDGWYIPSRTDINTAINALKDASTGYSDINAVIDAAGGDQISVPTAYYWSSNEHATDSSKMMAVRMSDKSATGCAKTGTSNRRGRAFKKIAI